MGIEDSDIEPPDLESGLSFLIKASGSGLEINLRSYALAAVASRLGDTADAEENAEIEFLLDHFNLIDPGRIGWTATLYAYISNPDPKDLPLIRLAEQMGFSMTEMLSVALALAVEDDVMVGRALARLQAPVGGSRPTLGLLAASFKGATVAGERPINTIVTGAAVRSGLLNVIGEEAPLPERAVSVPLHLCLALSDQDGYWPGTTIGMGDTHEVPLPPSTVEEASHHAARLRASSQRALVVRTCSVAEGKTVASTIAKATGRRPLFIETDKTLSLGPWLTLRGLLPVFCFELGPSERKLLPPIPYYSGPVLVLCGPDGSVESANETAISWSLAVPTRVEREQLWQLAVGDETLAAELARYHRHSSGRIAHLARLAHHKNVLSENRAPTKEDLAVVAWITEGAGLGSLAQPLTDTIPDEALVMTPALRNELQNLLLRCRARDGLVDGLGASATARYKPGVRGLFVGPSGTGKTLATGWLATKLGLPLYRVDLASVTSKYIGETEKNLAQLLARAEQSEVVLLFDEADSLFGKRTDVKDANDRFANAQTNYLLQRIESFDGITLLTSNSRSRFDSAFSRRLDVIIEFPLPGPEERRSMWQSHLGTNHDLSQRDLNQLAATADLCGGHIRNAVLTAAVLAQADARPIRCSDIIQGLMVEYKKLGRQLPPALMHSI